MYTINYPLKKDFRSVREALKEAMRLSYSLRQSDLYSYFGDCNTEQSFQNAINEIIESDDQVWSHFSLEKINKKRSFFKFSTASGKNTLYIEFDSKSGKKAKAIYIVDSQKPIEKSSAVRAFQREGWNLLGEIDETSQEELRAQYWQEAEESLVSDLKDGRVKGISFALSLTERKFGKYMYAYEPRIEVDPMRVVEVVIKLPQYAASLKAVAERCLKEMEGVIVPDIKAYNYPNTRFYNSSSSYGYYNLRLEEYRKALNLIIVVCKGLEGTVPQTLIEVKPREVKKPRLPRKPRAERAYRSEE